MFENLTTRPDPLIYFVAVFPISLLALAGGYIFAVRSRRISTTRPVGHSAWDKPRSSR